MCVTCQSPPITCPRFLGLGFGGTKILQYYRSGGLKQRPSALWAHLSGRIGAIGSRARSAARRLVLRIDPSLAQDEGKTLSLRDLGGPNLMRMMKQKLERKLKPSSDTQ